MALGTFSSSGIFSGIGTLKNLTKKMFTGTSTDLMPDGLKAYGDVIETSDLKSLEYALKSKELNDRKIKYISKKGSFILGEDLIPKKFNENERADIFEAVAKHGSVKTFKQFMETLYKTDDEIKKKSPHIDSIRGVNYHALFEAGLRLKAGEQREFFDFFYDGVKPEPANPTAVHSKESGYNDLVDIQDELFEHGAHVALPQMFTSMGQTWTDEGYELKDTRTDKTLLWLHRDGLVERAHRSKKAVTRALDRIIGDYKKPIEFSLMKYGELDESAKGAAEYIEHLTFLKAKVESGEVPYVREYRPASAGLQGASSANPHPGTAIATILILLGSAVAAAAAYVNNVYIPNQQKQQRVDQLINSGAMKARTRADIFDNKYSSWANSDVYNNSVLGFARVYDINQTIGDALGTYAVNPYAGSKVSVWQLANMTLQHLELAVDTPRQWKNEARLMSSVEGIDKYPILVSGGAVQTDLLLYGRGLAGSDKTTEDRAWNEFAIPAVGYIVKLVRNGNFTVDGLTREEAGRLLLPIELTIMDIRTGQPNFSWEYQPKGLLQGIINVSPLPGYDSPQEWLGKLVYRIYNEKGARYERAIFLGNRAWCGNYPLCVQSHRNKVKSLLENGDDVSVFIYGNAGLDYYKNGPDGSVIDSQIVDVEEQHTPAYMVLVGRSLGRVVVPHSADYLPPSKESHSDSIVRTKNGDYMGLWADLDAYFADCANVSAQPTLKREAPDGHYIKVDSKSR